MKLTRGNSSASSSCTATLVGFFLGDTIMDFKKCTICRKTKPVSEFNKRAGKFASQFYRSECIICQESKMKPTCIPNNVRRCYTIYRSALKSGKLRKLQHCSYCKVERKVEGHHADYSKPLKVIWVCHPCHARWYMTGIHKYCS